MFTVLYRAYPARRLCRVVRYAACGAQAYGTKARQLEAHVPGRRSHQPCYQLHAFEAVVLARVLVSEARGS